MKLRKKNTKNIYISTIKRKEKKNKNIKQQKS